MLELCAQRAGLADGMRVLDLGCGWGSFALWLAERHPASRIVAVSNSPEQRRFIAARAVASGLDNVEARTADVNQFTPSERFDRIVSVEMLEHMRNYVELMRRISSWLTTDGALFVHIFATTASPTRSRPKETATGWHATSSPAESCRARGTLEHFQEHMQLQESWEVPGLPLSAHRPCLA